MIQLLMLLMALMPPHAANRLVKISIPPDCYNIEPVADLLYGDQGCRWIDCADSFGVHYLAARTTYGMIVDDPDLHITAVTLGAYDSAKAFIRNHRHEDGRVIDANLPHADWYRLHKGVDAWWGLPVKSLWEVVDDATVGWQTVATVNISNGVLDNVGARLIWPDDADIRVRPLLLGSAPGHQAQTLAFDHKIVDLTAHALKGLDRGVGVPIEPLRHFAIASDLNLGRARQFDVAVNRTGSGGSWLFAGYTAYIVNQNGAPVPGVHYSTIADNSWSRWGFTANAESVGNKQFSREQMREWIYSTTVRNVPILYMVHLAEEVDDYDGHYAFMRDFMTEAEAWSDGLAPSFHVLFIINNLHNTPGNAADEAQNLKRRTFAAYDFCRADPRASYISMYFAMDGTYPTSNEKAGTQVEIPFYAWCQRNGYDHFSYGNVGPLDMRRDLLDDHHLHPADPDAATMLADIIVRCLHQK